MRNRVKVLVLPLLLVTAMCSHDLLMGQSISDSSGEPSNLTYRSSVSEVRLVFFATDEHNHAVEELQKDDFAVVDDERVIRNFRSFARANLIKLDVIVLMDSSESVQPRFPQEIADVQQLISQWPWGPGDNVSVLSFGGMETRLVCSGDCRSSFTAGRAQSLPSGGATPLFDAVELATNMLIQHAQPDVWRVIILFSDGDDTISKVSWNEVLQKVLASEAQIYAVDLSPPGPPSNGAAILQRMAEDSGGRRIRSSDGAIGILRVVIDDLHSARVVTYGLPNFGPDFHSIRILPTHNLKLQFRCRRGYYYRSGSAD